ncbi:hypothetical protein SNA_01250 [Streptomyces natalensis ATCC 27448]|uniref:Uncharacterized protein n=1 Tax=Streptomyces natalensis ATCC 27448 TaxID=1240678 RepID=A0A0D7CSJ1_9ACTN|nr:hypothetical protein SNA_01250 [Streptomyces natalensis ATCC 27448]
MKESTLWAKPWLVGRSHVTEEFQRCVMEELGVRAAADEGLEDRHCDVVVVGISTQARMRRS